jgi:hypothetical protein
MPDVVGEDLEVDAAVFRLNLAAAVGEPNQARPDQVGGALNPVQATKTGGPNHPDRAIGVVPNHLIQVNPIGVVKEPVQVPRDRFPNQIEVLQTKKHLRKQSHPALHSKAKKQLAMRLLRKMQASTRPNTQISQPLGQIISRNRQRGLTVTHTTSPTINNMVDMGIWDQGVPGWHIVL